MGGLLPGPWRRANEELAWSLAIGGVPVGYMSIVVRGKTTISMHTCIGGDGRCEGSWETRVEQTSGAARVKKKR